jgi:hypothetical protein
MMRGIQINRLFWHPLSVIFVFYALSYSLMIFNPGVFWDDWVFVNQSYSVISKIFIDSGATGGHPVATSIHYFLLHVSRAPGVVYHSLTFLLFFLAIVLFYAILRGLKIGRESRFIITLLFAVLPFNVARIYMATMPYTIGFVFALAGLLLFADILEKENILKRVVSLLCLFTAYYLLNSILVFAPACICLFLIVKYYDDSISAIRNSKMLLKQLLKWPDYLLLPVLYWIIKSIYLQPSNNYIGYNHVGMKGIITFPLGLLKTVGSSFLGLNSLLLPTMADTQQFILFVVLAALAFVLMRKTMSRAGQETLFTIDYYHVKYASTKSAGIPALVIIGIVLFSAGAFPYIVVGNNPNFHSTESRHQILLGIGTACMLFDLLRWSINTFIAQKHKWNVFVLSSSLTVSLFVTANFGKNIDALRTTFIQEAIKIDFKSAEEMKTGRNFIFEDKIHSLFWSQSLRYYSLSGMAKEVFGDQKRIIVPDFEIADFQRTYKTYLTEDNNMKDVVFDGKYDYKIFALDGNYALSIFNTIKILYAKYYDPYQYEKNINDISFLLFTKI